MVSTRVDALADARPRGSWPTPTRRASAGEAARAAALERYGLDRFLADWDAAAGGGGGR